VLKLCKAELFVRRRSLAGEVSLKRKPIADEVI